MRGVADGGAGCSTWIEGMGRIGCGCSLPAFEFLEQGVETFFGVVS